MMSNTLRLFKRTYTVAAKSVKGQATASSLSVMRTEAKEFAREGGASKEKAMERDVFWMRDPKTGNLIPETHFHEIDIAELMNKLLPCKPN